jgi:hypothetical protein
MTAQQAGDTAEADALIAELGEDMYPTHVANERGDFKTALELFPALAEDRGLAAVSIASYLAKRPDDRTLDDKFGALVCK